MLKIAELLLKQKLKTSKSFFKKHENKFKLFKNANHLHVPFVPVAENSVKIIQKDTRKDRKVKFHKLEIGF